MEKLEKLLEETLNEKLIQIILSNTKDREKVSKVKLRPLLLNGGLMFQETFYVKEKVYHKNLEKEEAARQIIKSLREDFGQIEITTEEIRATGLISKQGKLTLKVKKLQSKDENGQSTRKRELTHNRTKQYILKEGIPVPFLIDLGIMTKDGKIVHTRYDKFRQINRFLEFVEDILARLPKDREVRIIDFGCGKSYLTFAMYYYLKVLNGYDIRVTGLDLKKDVIERCSRLADKYGYDKLSFECGDIAAYQGADKVDMVVTLHACDTATDYALYQAIRWEASVILSVPCCQHELNGQMKSELLMPVLQYGLIKERMAALFTDGIRAQLLENRGYEVQVLEFIDMEHTPKNILLRAVKQLNTGHKDMHELEQMMEELQVKPKLLELLKNEKNAD